MLADANDKVTDACAPTSGGDDIADELKLLFDLLDSSEASFDVDVLRSWGTFGDGEGSPGPRDRYKAVGPAVTRAAAVGIATLPAVLTPMPAFAGTPLPPNLMLAMASRPAAPPSRDVPPALAATGPQLFPFTRPMQNIRSQAVTPMVESAPMQTENQPFSMNPRLRSMFSEQRKVAVTTRAVTQSGATFYRVQNGDSLYSIATEVLGSGSRWREIFEANRDKVGAGYLLRPGQRLVINSTPAPETSTIAKSYQVTPGDNLYTIAAKKLGNPNRWKEIVALNKAALRGRTTIYPNQWLILPTQQV